MESSNFCYDTSATVFDTAILLLGSEFLPESIDKTRLEQESALVYTVHIEKE